MTEVRGLYVAKGAQDKLTLIFDTDVPNLSPVMGEGANSWIKRNRLMYAEQAKKILDELQLHIPGGLMDALLAEMCDRKASILRVPL